MASGPSAYAETREGLAQAVRYRLPIVEPPRALFHYTSATGLHGMLGTGRVWATHLGYMNDYTELKYAERIVEDQLDAVDSEFRSAIVSEFVTRAKRTMNPFGGMFEAYAFCLSEAGDKLAQWRGYAHHGVGYSIGFDARMIGLRTPGRQQPDYLLRKVEYRPSAQNALVATPIREVASFLSKLARSESVTEHTHEIAACCGFLTNLLAEAFFTFKDPAFDDELEWRVVAFRSQFRGPGEVAPAIHYRVQNGAFVPYVELDLSASVGHLAGKLPVTKIVQGPQVPKRLGTRTLGDFVASLGYGHPAIEILDSAVPFRST